MSQLLVLSENRSWPPSSEGAATHERRTHKHACVSCAAASSASRRPAMRTRSTRSRLVMRARMRCCAAGSRWPRCMKCLPRDIRARRRPVLSLALAGRIAPRKPLVWVRQDFAAIESGALSMSGLCRTRPRSAAGGDGARGRCRDRLARHRGCARLRCGRHCRAGSVGRDAPARSRRQPKTHARRASLRRHRACCCGWRRRLRLRPRKPDGSCARRIRRLALPLECVGRAGVRRTPRSQPSWPGRAVDHGMEM